MNAAQLVLTRGDACRGGQLSAFRPPNVAEIRPAVVSPRPSVAIVIPAYNEGRIIGRCLESCIAQTSAPDEIIVVNNKSTDDTLAVVRRYQRRHRQLNIRLLEQNDHQGLIPTRNHGFDHARSDVIGRIDADTVIADDWVATIRRRFANPAVAAATGPVFYHDMPLQRLGFWETTGFAAIWSGTQQTSGFSWAPIWQSGTRRGGRSVSWPIGIPKIYCTKISTLP
ncbi:hypothetical protein NIIDMKKI_61640 [Mycobacterium kansasii]|uniref:Glycosyltransferase 2-like domain-containing protein n=1 Tax=Mycobacterium kansasii TaxID=1768 RepID=A0A7G1IQC4_MYCKA|nr:hypothetical protein NIIDMKKI_61640 [Mycobacterium kansasii]